MSKIILKTVLLLFLCLCHSVESFSSEQDLNLQSALEDRNYKKAIAIQRETIAKATPKEKGELTYSLVLLYLKDQDQENAFQTFLEVLDQPQNSLRKNSTGNPCDQQLYEQALAIYLDTSSPSPQATAQRLLDKLGLMTQKDPLLDYFVAISYANLGRYDLFIHYFHCAYQSYPDHYLAFKTKAILHIKLLERRRSEGERQVQREAISDNLMQAMQREPNDTTIYRMLIGFSQTEKKRERLRLCLNKILNDNIIIPRGDILFYVQEALDVGETALAHQFVCRSSEWYPQSRIVSEAVKKIKG
ncbi:MAG: hypothetical protein WCF65_01115 [Parachlamydiaceae bacterium]